jgi:hypothetical protein
VAAKAGIAIGERLVTDNAKPPTSPGMLAALEENTVTTEPLLVALERGDSTVTVPRGSLGIRVRPATSGGEHPEEPR